MSVSIPGYYTVDVAKNPKERLEGQTYVNYLTTKVVGL